MSKLQRAAASAVAGARGSVVRILARAGSALARPEVGLQKQRVWAHARPCETTSALWGLDMRQHLDCAETGTMLGGSAQNADGNRSTLCFANESPRRPFAAEDR